MTSDLPEGWIARCMIVRRSIESFWTPLISILVTCMAPTLTSIANDRAFLVMVMSRTFLSFLLATLSCILCREPPRSLPTNLTCLLIQVCFGSLNCGRLQNSTGWSYEDAWSIRTQPVSTSNQYQLFPMVTPKKSLCGSHWKLVLSILTQYNFGIPIQDLDDRMWPPIQYSRVANSPRFDNMCNSNQHYEIQMDGDEILAGRWFEL